MLARAGWLLWAVLVATTALQVAANRHPEIRCYSEPIPCKYRIGSKEWLGKIADRFGSVTISDIVALNPHLSGAKTPQKTVIQLPCQRPAKSGESVLDLLQRRPDMTVLVRAIYAAGLDEELADPAFRGTLFAPSNCAWKFLLADLDITEKMLLAQGPMLAPVLRYHLLSGQALAAADLHDGDSLPTVHGQRLAVQEGEGGRLQLRTETEQHVRLVQRDLTGGAALVHAVNEVMLPTRDLPAEAYMTRRLEDSEER